MDFAEYAEHQVMQREFSIHSDIEFLGGLTKDQLRSMDIMLSTAVKFPEYGNYIRGRIDGVLLAEHNMCPCGAVHESVESVLADPDSILSDEDVKEAAEAVKENGGQISSTMLEVYGMEWISRGDEFPEQLRCKNCFKPYFSMEDRMLRKPGVDGCDGCQLYSANGSRFPDESVGGR